MNRNKIINVFEYQCLKFSSINLTGRQIQLLAEFASSTREKYFQVGYNSVRFSSYVGILQIEDITIEILPKIERTNENEENIVRWRSVLLEMLNIAGIFPVDLYAAAYTKLQESTLLDVLFFRFIAFAQELLKEGLIKKYRKVTRNLRLIKGNIDVKKISQRMQPTGNGHTADLPNTISTIFLIRYFYTPLNVFCSWATVRKSSGKLEKCFCISIP